MEDLSNRTNILFALIKEFIQPEFTFLDIGCGFSPLYLGTDLANKIWVNFPKAAYCGLDTVEKIIEYCKISHPQYEWICIQAEKFKIEKKYNFVIHTGIDKLWSDGWQIHENLIASEFAPDYIFLEVGGENRHKNESQEIYDNLISKYQSASYHQIQAGAYFWNLKGIKAPWRSFVILGGINC